MYQRYDSLYNIDDAGQIVPTGPILDDGLDHGKALLSAVNMRLLTENGATFGRLIQRSSLLD